MTSAIIPPKMPCPKCEAKPGEFCVSKSGAKLYTDPHKARRELSRKYFHLYKEEHAGHYPPNFLNSRSGITAPVEKKDN
jgi:hypothetical protein